MIIIMTMITFDNPELVTKAFVGEASLIPCALPSPVVTQ